MPTWVVALISAGAGFLLGTGREVVKEWSARRKRRAFVRRLLAHHATMLVEDADDFLAVALRCFGLPEPEIAVRFRDATTHEHGYRKEIATHLNDLTDDLIDMLRDLDAASAGATTAVATLQRRSSEIFAPRAPGAVEIRVAGFSLTEEVEHAANLYRKLRDTALAVLRMLDMERAVLPSRARLALTSGSPAQLPTAPEERRLPKSPD